MATRQDGFYWVRPTGSSVFGRPRVAEWANGTWYLAGLEGGRPENDWICLSDPLPWPTQPGSRPVEEPSLAVPHLPPRRVVQLTVRSEGERTWPAAYVVCNDGTLWMLRQDNAVSLEDTEWRQLPEVPQ